MNLVSAGLCVTNKNYIGTKRHHCVMGTLVVPPRPVPCRLFCIFQIMLIIRRKSVV